MAKSRTHRRYKSKSKSKSKSRSRSRSRSRRGGAQPFVGSSWAPANTNMHQDLTSPSAIGNYFKPSPYGVPGGGLQPPVPEMNGPGIRQINTLAPLRGGVKRSRVGVKRSNARRKRGGYSLGGLPQLAGTAWDNATIGIQNVVKGFNGVSQLPSASPWIQPELTKPPNIPISPPIDLTQFRQTAAQRAANV